MWKIYATEDAGIAIRSTVGRLKRALDSYIDYPVTISSVSYINYDTDIIPENYLLHPMFFKRKSYEYENELRALVNTSMDASSGESTKRQTTLDDRTQVDTIDVRGLYATIDIDALIEAFTYRQRQRGRYMVRRRRPLSQGWKTFLRNHAAGIASLDLFVVRTISFKLLYGLVILRHARRRLITISVTTNPTAQWIAGQVTDAFPGTKRQFI
jgi:hypothetical protein